MYRLNKYRVGRGIAKSSFCLIFLIGSLSCGDGVINSYDSLTDEWTLMGLEGEDVQAIAVSQQDRNLIFAGSGSNFSDGIKGKLFRSHNAGTDWDTLLYGLTVMDIKFKPNSSSVIYASSHTANFTPPGIFKSTDRGDTWLLKSEDLPLSFGRGVSQMAIDPSNPNVIYACTGGADGGSLYKSTNGGDNWVEISSKVPDFNSSSVEISPSDPNKIYLGTSYIGGFFISNNAGNNWEKASLWEVVDISDISIDPNDYSRIVASGNLQGSATFISVDAGVTWNVLGDELSGASIVIDDLYSNIYVGGGRGIFKYDEELENWIDFSEGLEDQRVKAIEYIKSPAILLAGAEKGIYGRRLNVKE